LCTVKSFERTFPTIDPQFELNSAIISTKEGYNSLSNKTSKEVYIRLAFANMEISPYKSGDDGYPIRIKIPYYLNRFPITEISEAVYAFLNDRPDVFWIDRHYGCEISENGLDIVFYSYLQKEGVIKQKNEISNRIMKMLFDMPSNLTDYKKVLWIHDFIVEHCKYDRSKKYTPSNHNIWGPVMLGTGVCEGFSKMYKILCNAVGIKCELVTGQSKNELHMWNVNYFGKNGYHTDVTWDLAASTPLNAHDFLNIPYAVIAKDHCTKLSGMKKDDPKEYEACTYVLRLNEYLGIEQFNSTQFNFFNVEAVKFDSKNFPKDQTTEKIKLLSKNKEKCLHILIGEHDFYPKVNTALEMVHKIIKTVNLARNVRNKFIENNVFTYSITQNQYVLNIELKYKN
jgi:hypothetical protein